LIAHNLQQGGPAFQASFPIELFAGYLPQRKMKKSRACGQTTQLPGTTFG